MERKQPIQLTDAAARQIRALLAQNARAGALRLGVKNGGCAGQAYTLDYACEPPRPFDEVVEAKGVRIVIEAKALMFLLGVRMDWREDPMSSGFVFDNPNQVDACGCGESVTLKPAGQAPGSDER